jgi:RNA polymerase sigma factor (sigma-70 family)
VTSSSDDQHLHGRAGANAPDADAAPPDAAPPDAAFTDPRAEIDLETRGAVAGDADAMRDLWRRHRRWVAAILLAHKPRWADLDDLLQEVALSVVRKVGELRDPRAVRPWLRTVAINAAHAAGRSGLKRARDVSMGDQDPPREPPARGSRAELDEGRRLLELAERLPDGYREPLLLKAVQDLSYREIGLILGLPETTIETRIARGRRMLRELATQGSGADLSTVRE